MNTPNAQNPKYDVTIKGSKSKQSKASKATVSSKLKQAQDTAAILGLILLTIISVLAMVLPKLIKLIKQGQAAVAELRNNEEALKVGVAEMSRKAQERADAEFDRRVAVSMKKAQQGQNGQQPRV